MEERNELLTFFEQDEIPNWDDYEEEEEEIWFDSAIDGRTLAFSKTGLPEDVSISEAKSDETILSSVSSGDEASSQASSSEGTVTHPCLKRISMSDSEMKFANLYSYFAVPEDPGLERAFWMLYPSHPAYKANGIDKFFDAVKILGIAPIGCMKEQLQSDQVNLRYYGIDPEVVQALSEALLSNSTVGRLDLQDNYLTPDSCYYLNRLLLANTSISSLNLTACKIGVEGALRLEEGISLSPALRELNLSRCELGNEGFKYISIAASANALLRNLNVSDNNLDEDSAKDIQNMLKTTESIKYVDFSWNDLHTPVAAENIFQGLSLNGTLIGVDMSWNSMQKDSVSHICNYISQSRKLKIMNLSANRFNDNDVLRMAQALLKNRYLEEFFISGNPLQSKGVSEFIQLLVTSDYFIQHSPLALLDFESVWATKEVIPALEQLKETKPNLVIKLGGILENFTIVGPDLKELYFKSANFESMSPKKKKDRKNFGHFVLSLEDAIVTKADFLDVVSRSVPISDNLANQIAKQFLKTKKTVDQVALKESYMTYFPDTKLPEPPRRKSIHPKAKSKKSKGKKTKTSKKSSKKDKKKK